MKLSFFTLLFALLLGPLSLTAQDDPIKDPVLYILYVDHSTYRPEMISAAMDSANTFCADQYAEVLMMVADFNNTKIYRCPLEPILQNLRETTTQLPKPKADAFLLYNKLTTLSGNYSEVRVYRFVSEALLMEEEKARGYMNEELKLNSAFLLTLVADNIQILTYPFDNN